MSEARVAEIRRQMERVRCEMGDDVQQIVDSAKTMTDWRHYVENYPWVCIGAATALGYMLVPSRVRMVHPDAKALLELAKRDKIVVKASPQSRTSGLGGMLMGMVAKAALRGATAYFAAKLTQQVATDQDGPITGKRDDEAAVAAGVAG